MRTGILGSNAAFIDPTGRNSESGISARESSRNRVNCSPGTFVVLRTSRVGYQNPPGDRIVVLRGSEPDDPTHDDIVVR
jgi:hypothetical protein